MARDTLYIRFWPQTKEHKSIISNLLCSQHSLAYVYADIIIVDSSSGDYSIFCVRIKNSESHYWWQACYVVTEIKCVRCETGIRGNEEGPRRIYKYIGDSSKVKIAKTFLRSKVGKIAAIHPTVRSTYDRIPGWLSIGIRLAFDGGCSDESSDFTIVSYLALAIWSIDDSPNVAWPVVTSNNIEEKLSSLTYSKLLDIVEASPQFLLCNHIE